MNEHSPVLLIGLEAGQKLKDHSTASQVHVQVLSGSCVIVEAGRGLAAGQGDLVVIPPSSSHRIEAVSRSLMLVTLAPHPAGARFPRGQEGRLVSQVPHQTG